MRNTLSRVVEVVLAVGLIGGGLLVLWRHKHGGFSAKPPHHPLSPAAHHPISRPAPPLPHPVAAPHALHGVAPHLGGILLLVAAIIVVVGVGVGLWTRRMLHDAAHTADSMVYYQAQPLPEYTVSSWPTADSFLVQIAGLMRSAGRHGGSRQPYYRFTVVKTPPNGMLAFYFGVPPEQAPGFLNAFRAAYVGVELVPTAFPLQTLAHPTGTPRVNTYKLQLTGLRAIFPLRQYHAGDGGVDVLDAICSGMDAGRPGSSVAVLDVLFRPVDERKHLHKPTHRLIQEMESGKFGADPMPLADLNPAQFIQGFGQQGWGKANGGWFGGGGGSSQPKVSRAAARAQMSPQEQSAVQKLRERSRGFVKAYRVLVRVGVATESGRDAGRLLQSIHSGFQRWEDANAVVPDRTLTDQITWDQFVRGIFPPWQGFVTTSRELLGLVRIPDHTRTVFDFIQGTPMRPLRAPASVLSLDADDQSPADNASHGPTAPPPPTTPTGMVAWDDEDDTP